jgi:hypothetical protein
MTCHRDFGREWDERRHESHQRKSRMVEISSSGSGEGPGWVTSRPTLQRTDRKYKATFSPPPLPPASAGGRCALWTCRLGWGRLKPHRFLKGGSLSTHFSRVDGIRWRHLWQGSGPAAAVPAIPLLDSAARSRQNEGGYGPIRILEDNTHGCFAACSVLSPSR